MPINESKRTRVDDSNNFEKPKINLYKKIQQVFNNKVDYNLETEKHGSLFLDYLKSLTSFDEFTSNKKIKSTKIKLFNYAFQKKIFYKKPHQI